ncbi:hypothetical protein GW17_00048863, partial [Ensete ventricosum]
VHILPREMFGRSTFGLSLWLLKWLPVPMVDGLLLLLARLMLGDTARFGLPRPQVGPLELKSLSGKTPVLDVGTLARIKSGDIKVRPGVKKLVEHGAEFVDGGSDRFDAVILATGYKSNVPFWLKEEEEELFSENDGLPRRPFPDGWKGERGLYAVGFTKRGLLVHAVATAFGVWRREWRSGPLTPAGRRSRTELLDWFYWPASLFAITNLKSHCYREKNNLILRKRPPHFHAMNDMAWVTPILHTCYCIKPKGYVSVSARHSHQTPPLPKRRRCIACPRKHHTSHVATAAGKKQPRQSVVSLINSARSREAGKEVIHCHRKVGHATRQAASTAS